MNTKIQNIDFSSYRSSGAVTPATEAALQEITEIIAKSLTKVVTPSKNIVASADRLFRHPFGRDSAISAEKLLRYDPAIARQSILLMASTQGVKRHQKTEEKPGKIFHEMKFKSSDEAQQIIFESLRKTLGIGDPDKFISYTSIDATMEFIHLIHEYVNLCGVNILEEHVTRQDGKVVMVEEALLAAVEWLRGNIARSDIGLVRARRTNPNASIVADLLDGSSSFMHADGKTLINYRREVNTLNFQSLGYQALVEAADIATDKVASTTERNEWRKEADKLRQKTIDLFWMPDLGRVAMALDRDADGKPRQLKTESVLPAVALRTGLFDDRPDIIEAILKNIYTPSMMTCVGPRTQSLRVDKDYIRYHEPPWPVLVGRVIEGAIRYKEYAIARDLIERLLTGVYATGNAKEFHLIIGANDLGVYADVSDDSTVKIALTNRPEAPQAWTVATAWWAVNVALPVAMKNSESPGKIGSMLDVSINKVVRTVPYTIDQGKALEIEKQIQELNI